MTKPETRIEKDSMGEVPVPADAYYGAQTQRAVDNFPISGWRLPPPLIHALGLCKLAAATANRDLGKLDAEKAALILQAAREVAEGKLDADFPVDVFQTGSGTSSNMNTNEVIANRADELAGQPRGSKAPVHPNDHVNMGQSTNDMFPTAIHVAVARQLRRDLIPALSQCQEALAAKARAFDGIIKIGRTHLADATPIRLGQEFSGYARQLELAVLRGEKAVKALRELPVGGTAVGTGINTHPEFAARVSAVLSRETGIDFVEAANHIEGNATRDALVEAHGQLRAIAVGLFKVANDIRWLSSGPRCGIGEIRLPDLQPGSSIMPGKVNPVLCESVLQVCARVLGNDNTVGFAGAAGGNFELNIMMPVMGQTCLESIHLLAGVVRAFHDLCVTGIEANVERNEAMVEQSLAMVTSLAPHIGYDEAAAIAKEAFVTGKTVREVAMERNVLPEDTLAEVLDPRRMTEPQE